MDKVNGTDKLDLLKVRSAKVVVGERELVLRTSTLMQQKALVVALAKINPAPIFAAGAPLIALAGGPGFVAALAEHGPAVYRAAMEFLATSASDALGEAAAAVLDTEQNFRIVRDEEKAVGDEDRTLDGKRYISSDRLRSWVVDTITPAQAFHVLAAAVDLNDYRRLGGVLAALATGVTGAAKTSEPPATDSSKGSPGGAQA